MKTIILLTIIGILINFLLKSQVALTNEISNLKNNTGNVIVDFRDEENNFIKGVSLQYFRKSGQHRQTKINRLRKWHMDKWLARVDNFSNRRLK